MSGTVKLAERIAQYEQRIAELEQANANNLEGWHQNVAGLNRRIAELERDVHAAMASEHKMRDERDEARKCAQESADIMRRIRARLETERDEAREWGMKLAAEAKFDGFDVEDPPWERDDG